MNKSFTLIEILVVIVVIGVLSAFILVGMSSITNNAAIAKSKAFLNSMDSSILLGRVSQWKLDEASGVTASDSWLTNTGTLATAPGFDSTAAGYGDTHTSGWMSSSNCVSGTCLKFDGVDDNVDCGNNTSLDIIDAITISVWIKPTTLVRSELVHKGQDTVDGYELILRETGQIWFRTSATNPSTNTTSTLNVSANNWWHVAVYRDSSGNAKIYINGQEKGSGVNMQAPKTNVRKLYICGLVAAYSYYNGLIDDVRVYNKALSSSGIDQEYYIGVNKLFKNQGISLNEFNNRLAELKFNLATNE